MASFTLKEVFDEFLRQRCIGFPKLTSEKIAKIKDQINDLQNELKELEL